MHFLSFVPFFRPQFPFRQLYPAYVILDWLLGFPPRAPLRNLVSLIPRTPLCMQLSQLYFLYFTTVVSSNLRVRDTDYIGELVASTGSATNNDTIERRQSTFVAIYRCMRCRQSSLPNTPSRAYDSDQIG